MRISSLPPRDGPCVPQSDVSREKKSFLESVRRIKSLGPKVESKTWWFVRCAHDFHCLDSASLLVCVSRFLPSACSDELRIQAYDMRSSMLALNKVSSVCITESLPTHASDPP